MNSTVKDIGYINIAKIVGIFLVVLRHTQIPYPVMVFITGISMPFFFAVSGYLISNKTYTFKSFVIRKAKTLLIPYLLFAVVGFLFWYFVERVYDNGGNDKQQTLKYLVGIFYAAASKDFLGFNIPIWFLPCLFVSELLFFLARKWAKRYDFVFILLLFALGIVIKERLSFRLPWGMDVSFFAVPFLYIGALVRSKNIVEKYVLRLNTVMRIVAALLLGIAVARLSFVNTDNGYIMMYALKLNNYFLFFVNGILGALFILVLSNCFKYFPLSGFYGRNTIVILGLHLICFKVIKGFMLFAFNIPLSYYEDLIFSNLFIVIATFILLTPVVYLINRYIPFLLGRKQAVLS